MTTRKGGSGQARTRLVRRGLTPDGQPAFVLETDHTGAGPPVPKVEADVVPLTETNPVVAAQLVELFDTELRSHLSPDELRYFVELEPQPCFDVASLDGQRVLKLTFLGAQRWDEWDGTASDAREIVTASAKTAADSVSSDYWQHGGGWRTKTTFDESE